MGVEYVYNQCYIMPRGLGPTSKMIESTDGIETSVGYVTSKVS